jgi:AcrR family transcriptional regulator
MRIKDLEKQRRIKDAMVRLILREGIDGTSVSKIAREAGVSPATIYVYYDSKEEMLSEVFREYARRPWDYLNERIDARMTPGDLIETIVRGCYSFSVEHEDVFSFVEQCSRCPSLREAVCERECGCDLFDLIHVYQGRRLIRAYSDWSLWAVMAAPVRFLAANRKMIESDVEERLNEIVEMLCAMLLC